MIRTSTVRLDRIASATRNARLARDVVVGPEIVAEEGYVLAVRILEDKGHLRHTEEGRAHRYHPLVGREEAGRSALRDVLKRIFDGSPELLMTQLVSDRSLSDAEIRRMREILTRRLCEEE